MKFKKINISRLFSSNGAPSGGSACQTRGGECGCRSRCSLGGVCNNCAGENSARTPDRGMFPGSVASAAPSCRDSYTKGEGIPEMRDRGNEPIVFDIRKEAFMTPDFRTALWTGENLQLTVMTVPSGGEIGVEMHDELDQLIGVISGAGEVSFGNRENYFKEPLPLDAHSVVLVPAGTYHNVKNVGKTPLKLYSVYAPKAHKFGTVEKNNQEK